MNRRLLAAFYLLYALFELCLSFRKDDGDYLKSESSSRFRKKGRNNKPQPSPPVMTPPFRKRSDHLP